MDEDLQQYQYAWKCSICGELFEPTGHGHNDIRDHLREVHDTTPKDNVDGLVDVRTGDVIQAGWGPTVLGAARRRGYIRDKTISVPDMDDEEGDVTSKPDRASDDKPPSTTAKAKKLTAKERAALALVEQTGRTVLKDIVIQRPVELLFYEAQAMWPDLYGRGTTEDFSRFITDFTVAYAVVIGMNTGQMMAQEMAKQIIEYDLEGVEDDGDTESDGDSAQ